MSEAPHALLFLAADLDGRPRLLAALERGADGPGSLRLAPDATRISERDVRGRRAPLGALLAPHAASTDAELADVAAHLLPLPRLGSEEEPRTVDLRTIGLDADAFEAAWPAPGGGTLALRTRAFELPGDREGVLLASRGAPHGPWLRPIATPSTATGALLRLLGELGIGIEGEPLLATWLERATDAGGAGLEADRAELAARGLRELLREALATGAATPREEDGLELAVDSVADDAGLRWRFEVTADGERRVLEHATARFAPDAVAELLAVLDARLEPWWLLVFDRVENLGPTFVGLVDLRRYLVENLEALEGAGA